MRGKPCSWKLSINTEPRKSWTNRNITETKTDNETINSAAEIAEVFNDFVTSIGPNLASKLSRAPSNIDPESYLQPSVTTVCEQLSQSAKRKP